MDLHDLKLLHNDNVQMFNSIKQIFDISKVDNDIKEIEFLMSEDGFWDNRKNVSFVTSSLSTLKEKRNLFVESIKSFEDVDLAFELLNDSFDQDIFEELEISINELKDSLKSIYNKFLLNDKYDSKFALVEINAGAGGTESQDWVEMLFRMYTRYCGAKNFKSKVIHYNYGDMAGIKSVSFEVSGENAYGLLKSEKGVHRMVRISPFDSSGKRHTSFASVDVVPVLDEIDVIEIDKNDLKIDTYRASGAGGQSVNTTDSAVRITHLPTGIVVSCQNERSQVYNKEEALRILKNKLFAIEEEKRQNETNQGEKSNIGWGSQIRSYVFQPYTLVKDHRTNCEEINVKSVMDGDLDGFINAYLEFIAKER